MGAKSSNNLFITSVQTAAHDAGEAGPPIPFPTELTLPLSRLLSGSLEPQCPQDRRSGAGAYLHGAYPVWGGVTTRGVLASATVHACRTPPATVTGAQPRRATEVASSSARSQRRAVVHLPLRQTTVVTRFCHCHGAQPQDLGPEPRCLFRGNRLLSGAKARTMCTAPVVVRSLGKTSWQRRLRKRELPGLGDLWAFQRSLGAQR